MVCLNKEWSLFLDRDGVINHRLMDDYVKSCSDFTFRDKDASPLAKLTSYFGKTFVVTNQQGVGKGQMSKEDLEEIHAYLLQEVERFGGHIDKIYYCTELKETNSLYRKPNIGMGLQAKKDFPSIHFKKSLMVGDTFTDMLFGKRLNMKTVLIGDDKNALDNGHFVDYKFDSLSDLLEKISIKSI